MFGINFVWYNGKNFENDIIFQFKDFEHIIYEKINNSYIFLIKDTKMCIEELNGKTINSDCRLFSMLVSCLKNNTNSFLMQLSSNSLSPEVLVPKYVFYLTLDPKLVYYNNDLINLNLVLGELCGQWLIKDKNDEYLIGFTKEGILKKTYEEWKDFYIDGINKKLNIENHTQYNII